MECSRLKNALRLQINREEINAARRLEKAMNPEKYRVQAHKYWAANRDNLNERQRESYASDVYKSRERQRVYYHRNIERKRANARSVQRALYIAYPERFKSAARIANLRKKRAIPAWFGELDAFVWKEAISLASLRRERTGILWHVDHMIPLQAKEASGLHTWNNCQVIPAELNRSKSNKMILTEPEEWMRTL